MGQMAQVKSIPCFFLAKEREEYEVTEGEVIFNESKKWLEYSPKVSVPREGVVPRLFNIQ